MSPEFPLPVCIVSAVSLSLSIVTSHCYCITITPLIAGSTDAISVAHPPRVVSAVQLLPLLAIFYGIMRASVLRCGGWSHLGEGSKYYGMGSCVLNYLLVSPTPALEPGLCNFDRPLPLALADLWKGV
jgi:hypothetical protein